MTDKDIEEHHKMIKKLKKDFLEEAEKEKKELAESYKESRQQQKDRDDKKK